MYILRIHASVNIFLIYIPKLILKGQGSLKHHFCAVYQTLKNTFSFTPIASLLNVMRVLLYMTLCNLRPYFRFNFCCRCREYRDAEEVWASEGDYTDFYNFFVCFYFILNFDPTVHIRIFYTNLLHSINIVETLKRSSFFS